jgi:hypothetical protein
MIIVKLTQKIIIMMTVAWRKFYFNIEGILSYPELWNIPVFILTHSNLKWKETFQFYLTLNSQLLFLAGISFCNDFIIFKRITQDNYSKFTRFLNRGIKSVCLICFLWFLFTLKLKILFVTHIFLRILQLISKKISDWKYIILKILLLHLA